ncbi:MAG: hypothetical protein AMK72_07285 [Planctomycetes bacterium SM23_25]|nr:MAG: hypothetical protein AMS14_04715 [Planctomycetes bacterium DG_20]KPK48323.1 MAG: hypothetical protein AMK72_07285 [Planctomycetes bacterium SM23_25]
MSGESSSFHVGPDAVASELSGILKEAVEQIRAVPAPQEAVARHIERAAAWSDAEDADVQARPVSAGKRRWAFMAAAALVLIASTVVTAAHWMGRQTSSGQTPISATISLVNGSP